ncbi:MAG: hypothetical protein M9962_14785 [Oligoflexia bacterium]|nr:hypothetical protein [Oligoflexia bacterium]
MKFCYAVGFFLILFLSGASCSYAGLLEGCKHFFNRLSVRLGDKTSFEDDRFSPNGLFPYFSELNHQNTDPQFFWYVYDQLPIDVQSKLKNLPIEKKERWKIVHQISLKESFLDQFIKKTLDVENISELIDSNIKNLKLLNKEKLLEFEALLRDARIKAKVKNWWQKEAGVASLSTKIENGKNFIKINSRWIEAKVIGQKMQFTIDRTFVRRPAWNPLESTKKIIEMADKGVPPPKAYSAVIGNDENLYLLDGNHRFHIDTRKSVIIEVSYPPKSVEWRGMLDLIGASQPSEEEIFKLYLGELKPEELFPKNLFSDGR